MTSNTGDRPATPDRPARFEADASFIASGQSIRTSIDTIGGKQNLAIAPPIARQEIFSKLYGLSRCAMV